MSRLGLRPGRPLTMASNGISVSGDGHVILADLAPMIGTRAPARVCSFGRGSGAPAPPAHCQFETCVSAFLMKWSR